MFAISNAELEAKPILGDTVQCKICPERHKVKFGQKRIAKGNWVESDLAFYKCGGKAYLCGVSGKEI